MNLTTTLLISVSSIQMGEKQTKTDCFLINTLVPLEVSVQISWWSISP